jgi:hypothetical protein
MPNEQQILNELVRLLGSTPDKSTFRHDLPQNHEWLGAVLFILRHSDDIQLASRAQMIASKIGNVPVTVQDPQPRLIMLLQQMKREFEFKLGYAIPRNYIELTNTDRQKLVEKSSILETRVKEDNELTEDERAILLSEIAIFEASIGCARLSPDLISRFIASILKGAIVLGAGLILKKAADDLAEKLLQIMGWSLSG